MLFFLLIPGKWRPRSTACGICDAEFDSTCDPLNSSVSMQGTSVLNLPKNLNLWYTFAGLGTGCEFSGSPLKRKLDQNCCDK